MSTMLRTSSPEAYAAIDPSYDRRAPYVGQTVVFHHRPGESRTGKPTAPAVVTEVQGEDHVELVIIYPADDFRTCWNVPRRSDQNPINCWTFNQWDEEHYRPGATPAEAQPTGALDALRQEIDALRSRIVAEAKAINAEIGSLHSGLAALEAGRPAKA